MRRVVVSIVADRAAPALTRVRSAADIARIYREIVGTDPREHIVAVYLGARHDVLAVHIVSIGTQLSSVFHPREVFHPAVALAAVSLCLAHHHPSGDPTPSAEDSAVTTRLQQAGELLGIEVLDHVVIGSTQYWSFADSAFHAIQ